MPFLSTGVFEAYYKFENKTFFIFQTQNFTKKFIWTLKEMKKK